MTRTERESREETSDEDRALIEAVASVYQSEPLSPGRRRAFDQRLEHSIKGRRRRLLPAGWAPIAAAALMAAVWVVRTGSGPITPVTEPAPGVQHTIWESEILDASEAAVLFGDTEGIGEDEWLPDDYVAIADLLLPLEGEAL